MNKLKKIIPTINQLHTNTNNIYLGAQEKYENCKKK
jgi:hypothetical protein